MESFLTDVPNSSLYVPGAILVDSLGKEVIQGVTPEFEIAQTGYYRGKRANLGYCLGRRSAPAGNRCDTNFHFLFIEN